MNILRGKRCKMISVSKTGEESVCIPRNKFFCFVLRFWPKSFDQSLDNDNDDDDNNNNDDDGGDDDDGDKDLVSCFKALATVPFETPRSMVAEITDAFSIFIKAPRLSITCSLCLPMPCPHSSFVRSNKIF